MDGGLTAPERARAQAHVADCLRCQAMVGAMARITEAVPPVKAESRLRLWLTWLAPFAAAAAAVIIWVAIPGSNLDTRVATPQAPPTAASGSGRTEAKQQTVAPETPAPQVSTAAREITQERAKEEVRRDAAPQPTAMNDAAVSPNGLDKAAAQGTAAGTVTVAGNAPLVTPSAGPTAAAGGGGGGGAAAVQAPASLDRLGGGPSPGAVGEVTTLTGERPAAPAAPRAQGGAASANALAGVRSAFRQEAAVEILSSDPSIRWRLSGANVERSTNGGTSWELTRTGVSTRLTAGAAVSPTTIWVVGEAGLVLLSTDGRTWRRVPFPQITNLSAIRARDARSVTVAAADGRIFSTTDAGATWIPGPLQGF